MSKIRQRIHTCESDREWLRKFEEDIRMLAGMAQEMMVTHPSTVLSPLFRSALAEQAGIVESKLRQVSNKLCCDNPCEPLKERSS